MYSRNYHITGKRKILNIRLNSGTCYLNTDGGISIPVSLSRSKKPG